MRQLWAVGCIAILIGTGSVSAACGGGGWKSSGSSSKGDAKVVVVKAELPAEIASPKLDTARFDAISAKLNLTEDQWKKVSRARGEVQKEIEKLVKKQSEARKDYFECDGDCSDERRKVASSADALKAYDPIKDFERRLNSILAYKQMEAYNASAKTAAVSAHKG